MQSLLQDLVVNNFFAFLLIFVRMGVALMIMPGIGDSFVNQRTRLFFALAISFVLTPFLSANLPAIPSDSLTLLLLIISETLIGIFIGTVMRIMVSALDVAGMLISMQSGFATAIMFNPVTASQGSIIGAFYTSLGVALLFVTNMDHYMLASVVESYTAFPVSDGWLDLSLALETISTMVSMSFKIGVQIAVPFLITGMLLQVGFGLLGRLMPQVQVFFLAMPAQVFLSLVVLALVLSSGIMFWLENFEGLVSSALSR